MNMSMCACQTKPEQVSWGWGLKKQLEKKVKKKGLKLYFLYSMGYHLDGPTKKSRSITEAGDVFDLDIIQYIPYEWLYSSQGRYEYPLQAFMFHPLIQVKETTFLAIL